MMFLSAGEQHHEETWRDWFRDIGGLVPRENLQVRHKWQLAQTPCADNRQQPEDTWGQGCESSVQVAIGNLGASQKSVL